MSDDAFKQIVEAARQGDGFAITLMGLHLINTQTDVKTGTDLILHAADDKNVIWAKLVVSYMRSNKMCGLPLQNQVTLNNYAIAQFYKYISLSNWWAMAILGNMYYQGISVPLDREQGMKLLSCAHEDTGTFAKNLWACELIEEYGITPMSNLLERLKYVAGYSEKYKSIKKQWL